MIKKTILIYPYEKKRTSSTGDRCLLNVLKNVIFNIDKNKKNIHTKCQLWQHYYSGCHFLKACKMTFCSPPSTFSQFLNSFSPRTYSPNLTLPNLTLPSLSLALFSPLPR